MQRKEIKDTMKRTYGYSGKNHAVSVIIMNTLDGFHIEASFWRNRFKNKVFKLSFWKYSVVIWFSRGALAVGQKRHFYKRNY